MNLFSNKPYTFDKVVRIIFTLVFFLICFFLLKSLTTVLVPFFIALILAYLINPLVDKFQKLLRTKKRVIPVLISLTLISGVLYLLTLWISPLISKEVSSMGEYINAYLEANPSKDLIPDRVEVMIKDFIEQFNIAEYLSNQDYEALLTQVSDRLQTVLTSGWQVMGVLFAVVTIVLYLLFILIDYRTIADGWKTMIPEKYKSGVIGLVNDIREGMNVYFRAQGTVALIVGVLFAIGFSIINLPLGILLGLFVGALNLVPYLQIVGIIPAVFLALLKSLETGQPFWMVLLLVFIVFAVVQLIQDAVIVPKIMGNVTGLHPAIILLSLSIWGSLLGIIGMLIALPFTTLIISYYKRFVVEPSEEDVD